ncbi:peptidase M75 superfamily protein [Antarcticibacterium flavum]|uniref:Peptidase M75 superfamily protein n=1 Tax=Antarcticibacterium flavum TaxID=2058175 RepID=A0A5B7X6V0_9FLAO|nr:MULTISPECIES: imelysin family protein [Antarcticibacterium]MCM4159969.1 peptidase M75 superfamily protein [Antarcticibacterium sp. W02-3]QCY70438.1 peptidase M75 superfamily protein [Antarcticibacterium flavum]
MTNYNQFFSLVLVALMLVSCTSDDGEREENGNNFDRGALLENWADNIIVPSFQNFALYTEDLEAETEAFVQDPSEASLAQLRNSFEEAYIQFQTVAPFGVGMAETVNYRMFLNTYPVDVATVKSKIESGSYNLELPSSYDEQGFPALDFLLNGVAEQDADIIEYYSIHTDASNYGEYLQAVSSRINKLTQDVLVHWQGSYRDDFVSNTGSSTTGSVDRFTNNYVMYYEKHLRTGKIGIPAGAFTGNPVPQNVEALYSQDLSKDLYLKAVETVKNFFNGKHFGSNVTGPSYKQYLDHLNTVKNSTDLSSLINTQFDAIEEQANDLNNNFLEQVQSNNTVMLEAFDALQKNVVLLKVDMLQALSISVDYVDTDGD